MSNNDRIILDQVLDQQQQSLAPSFDTTQYFEVFTAEQALKDYDLSYDEIEAGIVAGGGDGGIDSLYIIVNGELCREDSDFSDLKKNITIEVFIIQSKTGTSFSESTLDKLIGSTADLFDLSKPLSSLSGVYNSSLLKAVEKFRTTYQDLASKFPKLHLSYFYATKGDKATIHPNVARKVTKLESIIRQLFSDVKFDFNFLGARELLELVRRVPTTSYELKLSEVPISSSGDVAYVCLVSLRDFYKFITDSQGHLLRHIFEANVRDYQGKTQVNEEIQASLQNRSAEDFWWLNNGITVLASKAVQSGKTITLENPEVVNGLQTSTEIYNYFSTCNTVSENRTLLIRVIVPTESESRDRIIRATNSQTAMQPASLRATNRIHRDIEEYMKPFGLYYDRRKNYYKNEKKPINRIVSIPELAQAIMSIVLKRPDTARARPSSLIKRDEDYKKLFSGDYPIEVYRACVEILKRVNAFLNAHPDNLSASDKTNLKFYIAMTISQEALQKHDPTPQEIAAFAGSELKEDVFLSAYELVNDIYSELGRTDQIAKGSELVSRLNQNLQTRYDQPA